MREPAGISRRKTLGTIGGLGAAGVLAAVAASFRSAPPTVDTGTGGPLPLRDTAPVTAPPERVTRQGSVSPIATENARPGTRDFTIKGHRLADEKVGQIAGYVDRTSVAVGGKITFHVSVAPAQKYQITVYRLGHYDGAGARLVASSPWLDGVTQPAPRTDPGTGAVSCAWSPDWRLQVSRDHVSGYHLALLRNAAGRHWWIPFVVSDPGRRSAGLVVIPTSTYQAYNDWPADGRTGASLYYGFDATGARAIAARAWVVSHDRPYGCGGLPGQATGDIAFVQWAEEQGYDLTYATSEDLHTGRVTPHHHRAVVFAGHDEYWTTAMRTAVTTARDSGTSLVFLAPNNCYWRIRYEDGGRLIQCAKSRRPGRPMPPTGMWREAGSPEQELIGTQYVSVVDGYAPLVVRNSRHWFWAGTGVADGDQIPRVVWGEADQRMRGVPVPRAMERSVLANSPYTCKGRVHRQHTHLYRAPSGAWVFAAGTFGWTRVLRDRASAKALPADPRVQQATRNLLNRVLNDGAPPGRPATGQPRDYINAGGR